MGEIDLDPASSEVANRTVKAKQFYNAEDDGLRHEWRGRVWMNPPYSSKLIRRFCAKLVESVKVGKVIAAIVLVNNATETGWFQSLAPVASACVFTSKRVRFLDPNGKPGAPLQGQAILYIGGDTGKFIAEFSRFGWSGKICTLTTE